MIGQYAAALQELFEALNSLFLTITTIISRFIPLAVFCSVSIMLLQLGGKAFLQLVSLSGTLLTAIFCMLIVYGLLILIVGRQNPLTFYKKNKEGMLTAFSLSSSTAAMPTNMNTCIEKFGVSPKICSFSIPPGATVNMDGTCINLVIMGLFLAKAYGVTVPGSAMLSMMATIIMLSLGCPGVPGAGLICVGVVLEHLGVPVEAIGLVIGIYPILDMFNTMSNTTGDVAAAVVVASREKLLDRDVYNDPEKI